MADDATDETDWTKPLPTEPRDLAMGRFMEAWSQLEASLRDLLSALSGAPDRAAFSIAAAIPDNGRMQELLLALGNMASIDLDEMKELKAICEHLQTSNRYRNHIVHGQWINASDTSKPATASPYKPRMWLRVYTVIDKRKEFDAVMGWDEKARKLYVFSVARLEERALSALALADRITRLKELVMVRNRMP